jgi:hypothetical protein
MPQCIAQLDVLFSFSEIATDTAGGGQLTMCRPELLDPGHGDSAEVRSANYIQ